MSFSQRRQMILSVRGSMSEEETEYLYDCAAEIGEGTILEVGSWRGRSSTAMGLALLDQKSKARIYAVDPQEDFVGVYGGKFGAVDRGHFYQNMLRSQAFQVVRLINLSSEIVSPGWVEPLDLLFIDGDHSYEGVKRDADCWLPHLKQGCKVIFDDAMDPEIGPHKLIEELLAEGTYEKVHEVGKVATLKKL